MKASKWMRKYFSLAVLIVFLFVVLGFFVTRLISTSFTPKMREPQPVAAVFMARMLDELKISDKVEALKRFEQLKKDDTRSPDFLLLDASGRVVYKTSGTAIDLKMNVEKLNLLQKPYDFTFVDLAQDDNRPVPPPPRPPMPLDQFGFRPPPPMGGPGPGPFNSKISIIRLNGEPVYYLGISHRPMRPDFEKDPQQETFMKWAPFLGIGSLFLSLLIGIGVTLFIIYLIFYRKIIEADQVISELHKGNLKARFKINRNDEFGEAMGRFNQMASEIELLVERLREAENSRTKLIQELAHDLRTPIASIKNLVDLLSNRYDQLQPQVKNELWQLAQREVRYFELLIEELLTLSQFNDPTFDHSKSSVDLKILVKSCIDDQLTQSNQDGRQIEIDLKTIDGSFLVRGDELLLKRMLRNLIENAHSFAKSKIICRLEQVNGQIQFSIQDDGLGLSSDQIQNYGRRKSTRQIIRAENKDERISIGLGTVIIRKIVEIHRGQIHVQNNHNEQGQISGAEIKIQLPSTESHPHSSVLF